MEQLQPLYAIMIAALFGLIIIAALAGAFHFFVALNQPPSRRAIWTVGPAYALFALIGIFGGVGKFPAWAWVLGGIVPAMTWYWFWLRDFQKHWFASIDKLPDGVPLANDDWKNGLLQLTGLMVFGLIVALIRRSL